ncbi:MAG: hypothetical protein Q8N47_08850 [Bryobacterales bacterium]|nr:hypothetical protein [Bryobacterales bacterium]
MSLTPENFAGQYMPLTFTACDVNQAGEISDGSSQQVSVRKYLNANFRYKKSKDGKTVMLPYEVAKGMPYTEMKDALLGFVLDRAKKNKGGLHLLAGSIIYCFDTNPNISVSLSIFQHAFDGKCTPSEVRDVLRLFAYWHKADSAPRKRWQDPQAFADQCLGLDCNGLVGSFFKTQYSWLGIGPETAISSYETCPRAKVRKSLAEIESLDVLVFPGYVHIAVIGNMGMKGAGSVTCNVCQSTGMGLNGLQTTQERITFDNGKFKVGNSEVKAIVCVAG